MNNQQLTVVRETLAKINDLLDGIVDWEAGTVDEKRWLAAHKLTQELHSYMSYVAELLRIEKVLTHD